MPNIRHDYRPLSDTTHPLVSLIRLNLRNDRPMISYYDPPYCRWIGPLCYKPAICLSNVLLVHATLKRHFTGRHGRRSCRKFSFLFFFFFLPHLLPRR